MGGRERGMRRRKERENEGEKEDRARKSDRGCDVGKPRMHTHVDVCVAVCVLQGGSMRKQKKMFTCSKCGCW